MVELSSISQLALTDRRSPLAVLQVAEKPAF
jgi:hypothetical protein